jgi:uncharacterized protein (TIGR00266 family)
MQHEILYSPAYSLAIVKLETGEELQAESGAMVSMSEDISIDTGTRGGIMSGLKRSVLGGESFFLNTFKAKTHSEVTIAPALPGDIVALELSSQTLLVQSGSYLASTKDVNIDTSWGGARSFFSREGLFLLKCTGTGTIFLSSYGAIRLIELQPGEKYRVDTGHMVAFDESVQYDVGRSGGWKTTMLGGEGMVCRLTGPGRFYMQTRSPDSFLAWLVPKLPGKRE